MVGAAMWITINLLTFYQHIYPHNSNCNTQSNKGLAQQFHNYTLPTTTTNQRIVLSYTRVNTQKVHQKTARDKTVQTQFNCIYFFL